MSINFNDHDLTTSGIITAASGYFTTLTINNSNFNSSVSGLLPTITNSGDNRILTSTGSTVGINAESNLTFSDGVLTLGSTGNAISSQINLYNSDSNDTFVSLRLYDTNNNLMVCIDSDDDDRSNYITSSIYPLNITSSETFTLFTSKNLDIYATSGTTLTGGNLRIANQTASTIASFDSNKNIVSLNTSTYPSLTELSYIKGVTSAIQTQIDSKAATSTTVTAGSGLAGGGSLAANRTIDVGQGDGISVSADSIAVDSTVVRTTGVQTISGSRTYTAAVVFSSGVTVSGNFTMPNQTASTIAGYDANKNVSSLSTSTYPSLTELSYVKGVTSAIQTQIDAKAATSTTVTAGSGLAGGGSLASNRTIDIGQGDGISVSADSIAVDSTVIRTTGVQTMSGAKTFTAATVFSTGVTISSSGTNVPLTITNDGTGNSFVVNDVTGDTSPFVINNDGRIGIGYSTPDYPMHIVVGASGTNNILSYWNNTNNTKSRMAFQDTSTTYALDLGSVGNNFTIETVGVEKFRIDGSGNIDFRLNSGSISHRFTYNENGGEIILHDDAQGNATLIDQCSNQTRILELINGSDMVIGLGGSNTTGAIKFMRAGFSEAMRIDSSGNVGIGTNSPSHKLDVNGEIRLRGTGASTESGKFHLYYVSSTNRATWTTDSSGNAYLETGSSSPAARFWVNVNGRVGLTPNNEKYGLQLNKSSTLNGPFIGSDGADIFCVSTAGGGELFRIQADGKTGIGTSSPPEKLSVFGDTNAGRTSILIDNLDQRLKMSCYYESGVGQYAEIQSLNNAENGYPILLLNRQGGNVGIGTAVAGTKLSVTGASAAQNGDGATGIAQFSTGTGANGDNKLILGFVDDTYGWIQATKAGTGTRPLVLQPGLGEVWVAGTTDQGAYNLQCNGTAVWGAGAYVNGSDERIKNDIVPLSSCTNVIESLRPVTFRYKESWSKDQSIQPGFIAQDLQQALAGQPYINGVVQQGTEYLSVAYQTLIPLLVKALQESNARIVVLEQKLSNK